MAKITFPWGDEELEFELPARWELMQVCEPKDTAPVPNIDSEIDRSLAEPVGSPRLSQMARDKHRVLIVVDDITRPTPVHLFFAKVVKELESAGVPREKMLVIPGLGVHRDMTQEEMEAKVGAENLSGLKWINHAYADKSALVALGKTSRGTPVAFNRHATEADLIVSLGCIEPHVIAGFGGGYKNLMPGVAASETIGHNHGLHTCPEHFNMVGVPPEENPMRLDLEEAGNMLNKPVFIVNAVLNGHLQVVRLVSGDPIAAHREGITLSREIFGVPIREQADVVISNSFPLDADLRQGFKSIANTIRAARPGGVVISFLRTVHGIGDGHLPTRRIPLGKRGIRILARLLLPVFGRLKAGGRAENNFTIYFSLQSFVRNKLFLFAPGLPDGLSERLPFMDISRSPQEVLRKAAQCAPPDAKVLVFPRGGMTYPIVGTGKD